MPTPRDACGRMHALRVHHVVRSEWTVSDALRIRLQAALGDAYVLERELTGGGMSRVFLGRDTMLGRRVVLKVLPPETATHEPAARFRHEAILAARLQHPHIVPVYAVGHVEDIQYFTMPFIDGESLRALLERRGALPAADVRRVLREIGGALACAHRHGIVHRDVKPENIFIERTTGRALLADFGVALALGEPDGVTQPGVTVGTPAYMSPEQVDGGRVNGLSDIYSLGLVGWEMLTGQRPWPGDSLYDVMYKQKHESLPALDTFNIDVAPHLAAAIERALRKDPRSRWPNAEAFIAAVDPDAVEQPAEAGQAPVRVDQDGAFDDDVGGLARGWAETEAPTVVARVRRSEARGTSRSSAGWPADSGRMRYVRRSKPRRPRALVVTTLVLLAAVGVAGAATVGRQYLPASFSTIASTATPSSTAVSEEPPPGIDTVSATTVAAGLVSIASGGWPRAVATDAPTLVATPVRFSAGSAAHSAPVTHRVRRNYPDARVGTSVRARVATAELELHSYEHVMASAPGSQRAVARTESEHAATAMPSPSSAAPPLAPAIPTAAPTTTPTATPAAHPTAIPAATPTGPNTEVPAAASPDSRSVSASSASSEGSETPARAAAVRVAPASAGSATMPPVSSSCRPAFQGSHVCRVYDERTGRIVEYQYVPNGSRAPSP
jgi:Protein kinase domain